MSVKVYKLKSLSVHLCGKVFKKSENPVFSTANLPADKLEDAEKAGFLELVSEEKVVDNTPADDYELDTNLPARDILIENKITTYEQLDAVEDLTSFDGIGNATAKKIIDFLAENN